jgi:hypothetical protein
MSLQEVQQFLQAALECSVYLAPREPGLAYDELLEAGKRAGFQEGEIGDGLRRAAHDYAGKRLIPGSNATATWHLFNFHEEPEYRNFGALDLVYSELNARVKAHGEANAKLERETIVERAVMQGIPRNEIEAAITILIMCAQLTEKDGLLRYTHGGEHLPLPSDQRKQVSMRQPIRRTARALAYPIVKDIIERRTDGRPKHTEPLDAFADQLDKLGYGPFRLWWKQIVAELRLSDVQSTPVSVSVLSAALVEGALTFVVNHARRHGLGVFDSKTFEDKPTTWRIDDLVTSAAMGRDSAILDAPTRHRAEVLIRIRQRIHAGRMLSEFPAGVPDLRPDEARDAKTTAELVVRRVLDWLERYPPPAPPTSC